MLLRVSIPKSLWGKTFFGKAYRLAAGSSKRRRKKQSAYYSLKNWIDDNEEYEKGGQVSSAPTLLVIKEPSLVRFLSAKSNCQSTGRLSSFNLISGIVTHSLFRFHEIPFPRQIFHLFSNIWVTSTSLLDGNVFHNQTSQGNEYIEI